MAQAKLIVFKNSGYSSESREFLSNDPNLVLNNADFEFASAIVASGNWTLYDDVSYQGNSINLVDNGGPELDGCYKDYADWPAGSAPFHVKSIQHA